MNREGSIRKYFLEQSFEWKLESIENFSDTLESAIEKETKLFAKWAKEKIKNLPPDVPDDIYSDEYWELKDTFPNMLRCSVFVSLNTLIEKTIIHICISIASYRDEKVALSDFKGQGIERAKTYMKKVLDIDFPSDTEGWQSIQNYRKLRNEIVHKDGEIRSSSSDEVRRFVESNAYLDISEANQLEIKSEFIVEACHIIKSFMAILFERISIRFQEDKK